MPIRAATYSDLWPAAQVMAAAFKDNELFGEYMHPLRSNYPNDMQYFFLRMLRLAYVSGSNDYCLISYRKDAQNQEELITGYAHWQRFGATRPQWRHTVLLQRLTRIYNYLESFVYPDRALDPSTVDILERAHPYVAHHWTGTRGNVWNLSHLGVDPKEGGQGFGRELVHWGFDRAREEGVGCSVISADGKEEFYVKCGFDIVLGMARDEGGDGNPLKDVRGGTIHIWDNGITPVGLKKYGEA